MSTEIVVSEFIALIDNEKEYSLVEIKKILGDVYKNAYKKEKKSKAKKSSDDEENPKEKKPPSAYNIFVKENMNAVKEEYPDLTNQQRMSKIGELWAIKKEENKVATEVFMKEEEEIVEEKEVVEEVIHEILPDNEVKEKSKKSKKGGKKDKNDDK